MYCCDPFKWKIENAGERRFSIVFSEGKFFYQFRCVEQTEEFVRSKEMDSSIKELLLLESQQIFHCVQCGTRLSKLAKKYPGEYRALSEKHKIYFDENVSQKNLRGNEARPVNCFMRFFSRLNWRGQIWRA